MGHLILSIFLPLLIVITLSIGAYNIISAKRRISELNKETKEQQEVEKIRSQALATFYTNVENKDIPKCEEVWSEGTVFLFGGYVLAGTGTLLAGEDCAHCAIVDEIAVLRKSFVNTFIDMKIEPKRYENVAMEFYRDILELRGGDDVDRLTELSYKYEKKKEVAQ